MNCLHLKNISKSIADITLFQDISFVVNKYDKIALISKNGAGKTTLLNIIAGIEPSDSGQIEWHPGLKKGYLKQESDFSENKTVLETVMSSDNPIIKTIYEYESAVIKNDNKSLQLVHEKMETLNAWDYERQVKKILHGLNIFSLDQKIKTLSGGEKKRVALANVLINEPAFIILDEPTNHLDINMIEWLEDYLCRKKITLLMVTHDRFFLDRVCTRIFELEDKRIFFYEGNYSYFLEKRAERQLTEKSASDKAKNLLRKELEWMRRMPKARGSKSKKRKENFYELEQKARKSKTNNKARIEMSSKRLGNKILNINNIRKSYEDNTLIKGFNYSFSKHEKVGIVGKNGCGKTSLLNIITGRLEPDEGTIEKGETVKFGYYHQEGLHFDQNQKVIDIIREKAEIITINDNKVLTASQYLNYFLFPPERQYDHVYKLSGGEKRRLYLCSVLIQNPNFLILDEPTNDLDIITLNVLEEYLQQFKGCLIIVSHDRYFLNKLVDHLFVFKNKGNIDIFSGNYDALKWSEEFEDKKNENSIHASAPGKKEKQDIKGKTAQSNKLTFREKYEFEQLEKDIETLEKNKQELENVINEGIRNTRELHAKTTALADIIEDIDKKMNRWLELSEKI